MSPNRYCQIESSFTPASLNYSRFSTRNTKRGRTYAVLKRSLVKGTLHMRAMMNEWKHIAYDWKLLVKSAAIDRTVLIKIQHLVLSLRLKPKSRPLLAMCNED